MSLHPGDANRPSWTTKDSWSSLQETPGGFPSTPRSETIPSVDKYGSIAEAVRARKDEYTRKKTIKIKVGTWNVASIAGAEKDLGGWFGKGLGVKGLTQDLSGLSTNDDSYSSDASDDAVEAVHDQEARYRKKTTTLPENDQPAIASGDEVDLYVLGLQEVVDISSMTEAVKPHTDPNPARRWKHAVRKSLPHGYKKVVEQQLLGLLLLVFASPALVPEISAKDTTSVGTGLLGYMGNKGAVAARLLLGESTRMVFVNCHLAAGADATSLTRRIWDTNQILSKTKFAAVKVDGVVAAEAKAESIGDEDFAFWFGDLNYRLDDIPGEDVRRLLLLHTRNEYDILNHSKRKIDSELGFLAEPDSDSNSASQPERCNSQQDGHPAAESDAEPPLDPKSDPASLHTTLLSLLAHDQLRAQQRTHKAFHEGWREGEINFLPTYKYDVGSVAMFDSGEKKRSPSWCDRILYRTRLDYDMYCERVKREAESRKKDEELKKRGIDDAAAQEDVLFDYDPENDGNDYFDDINEDDEAGNDIEMIRTQEGFGDAVELEEYIAHQRVISSDHKPLSAVFKVVYDSVVPELKQRTYQEVARDFDKAENEARPSVTVVLDHGANLNLGADLSPDAPELKILDYGKVRYNVPDTRSLTIANTGQIEVSFAFVNRPGETVNSEPPSSAPDWLKIKVAQLADHRANKPLDLGTNPRYCLQPGETTNVELILEVRKPELVQALNKGDLQLDDILVLRISNGRDFFIPVKGAWQQSCFYRTIEELVSVPSGVRSLTSQIAPDAETVHQPTNRVQHSAPQELFALVKPIPKTVERVIAEWDMVHDGEVPPWKDSKSDTWPFVESTVSDLDQEIRMERLAEIREALDTASAIEDHLSTNITAEDRLSLLCETLLEFLRSLQDGIITAETWQAIEDKLIALEKQKHALAREQLEELVMEAMSSTPIHSVSLTFVTFILSRIITELSAEPAAVTSPQAGHSTRSRSSTTASTFSDVSINSEGSSWTKRSFIPSFARSHTNTNTVTSPTSPNTPITPAWTGDSKTSLAHRYAELFAPLLIRSDPNVKLKSKEKKAQDSRKVKALEALLQMPAL